MRKWSMGRFDAYRLITGPLHLPVVLLYCPARASMPVTSHSTVSGSHMHMPAFSINLAASSLLYIGMQLTPTLQLSRKISGRRTYSAQT